MVIYSRPGHITQDELQNLAKSFVDDMFVGLTNEQKSKVCDMEIFIEEKTSSNESKTWYGWITCEREGMATFHSASDLILKFEWKEQNIINFYRYCSNHFVYICDSLNREIR